MTSAVQKATVARASFSSPIGLPTTIFRTCLYRFVRYDSVGDHRSLWIKPSAERTEKRARNSSRMAAAQIFDRLRSNPEVRMSSARPSGRKMLTRAISYVVGAYAHRQVSVRIPADGRRIGRLSRQSETPADPADHT